MNEILTTKITKWRVWGTSIQGAQHKRKNIPNQDAILWSGSEADSEPIIMAISDGHGSSASFRSSKGSEIAVEVACQVFPGFMTEVNNMELGLVDTQLQTALFPLLIANWKSKVQEDFQNNPLTEEDLRLKNGAFVQQDSVLTHEEIYIAYGATLLIVCISSTYIIYFQLGDGDILIVDELETVSAPLPDDRELIANETHSLCSRDALGKIRYDIVPLDKQLPLMILLSSDGYSNAFESKAAFYEVGTDYLKLHRTEGVESLKELVPAFLEDASRTASGDDVTLGIIKRVEHFDTDTLWDELKRLRHLQVESESILETKELLLESRINRMERTFWVTAIIQFILLCTAFLFLMIRN
jgi:serine/threonine protein phosphatase PrpC